MPELTTARTSSTGSKPVRVTSSSWAPTVPHRPFNLSDTDPVHYIVARSDPNEEESVVPPHLA
jgi:hypothetical protein